MLAQILVLGWGLLLMGVGIGFLYASQREGRMWQAMQTRGVAGEAKIVDERSIRRRMTYDIMVTFEYTPPGSTEVYRHGRVIGELTWQQLRGEGKTIPIVYLPDNPHIVDIKGHGLDVGVTTDAVFLGVGLIVVGLIIIMFAVS